jgi:VanZ family protein
MKYLFVLTIVGVTYGSIYPFDFISTPVDEGTIQALWATWGSPTGLGDTLGNIVLFVPYGLFGILAEDPKGSTGVRLAGVTLAGLGLAIALQIAQLYLPSRDPNLQDAVWNLVGVVLGMGTGLALTTMGRSELKLPTYRVTSPILIIASWFCYRLIPFVPSLDWQQVKNSLKPLLLHPALSPLPVLHDALAWAIVASLWGCLIPSDPKARYLLAVIPTTFVLEILMLGNQLSASNLLGAILGMVLWWTVIRSTQWRTALLIGLLVTLLAAQGLSPLAYRIVPEPFHWLPFYGFLGGSMLVNTCVLFEKFFYYGALLWLLRETGASLKLATVYSVGFVVLIEWAQTHLSNHTPEITDPLLVLILALVFHATEAPSMASKSSPHRSPIREDYG